MTREEAKKVFEYLEERANTQEPCDDAISHEEERYNKGFYDGYTRATKQANAVIEDIKAEIEGLMSHDDYMVDGFNVLDIIDKHIKRRVKNEQR